jgi:hypothetical protein
MRLGPIIFLGTIFLLVLVYAVITKSGLIEGLQNQSCPSLLVKRGSDIFLYTDPNAQGDPIRFSNLEEYITYVENQRSQGIDCPVLALQEEAIYGEGQDQGQGIAQQKAVPVIDSNDDRNAGQYPGFDPLGLQIGTYTKIDEIHDSTAKSGVSDNPMDLNWGGVQHTQQAVDSGKYEENQVTKPVYFTPKNNHIPGLYKNVAEPPSFLHSTGSRS